MRARLALVVLVALLAAACGGDDDADDVAGNAEGTDEATDDAGGGDDGTEDESAGDGAAGDGPGVGDHWHAAYGIYICDDFVDPLLDESDPEGIHTHGDGVIHIHPFEESAAGENATLGKFFEAMQIELDDGGLFSDAGSLEAGIDCPDGPAEVRVARWTLSTLNQPPTIIDSGLADIRFTEDLEIYTLAFAPTGAEIPPPPSIGSLGSLSDVDPSELPDLPPGFTVARVDPPGAGEAIEGETPCPAEDGSSPRTTEFSGPPPMCIDPEASYTATFVTNRGDVVVELDAENAPETVNNFVVLARYHYYDDTALFRTAPSIDIIQGGAPHSNDGADIGPGYTIDDEGDGYSYEAGDLAMARTAQPDSASAQFFFSAGPNTANLDGPPGNPDGSGRGTYVVFGRTVEGLDVLEEIIGLHVPDPALAGGGPGEPVIVERVVIEES